MMHLDTLQDTALDTAEQPCSTPTANSHHSQHGTVLTLGTLRGPGSTVALMEGTPSRCLTWLVATWTAAAVVYPLTRALERNSVMKPSWKKLMAT